MKGIAHFFIDRPIFAIALSFFVLLVGTISYFTLSVSQYPNIAPPTVVVSASYPGASSEIAAKNVAAPLEQEINGVEDMIYMTSQSSGAGVVSVRVVFKPGTDLDKVQVLVQNRVQLALPRLPEAVRKSGVSTAKSSPDEVLVVSLYSPDNSYDQLYLANYAVFQLQDQLARIDGVGEIALIGGSEYSMRVWLDIDKINALSITASEVVEALRGQNVQVAGGSLNALPSDRQDDFEFNIQAKGRLLNAAEFEKIVIKSINGRLVYLKDISKIELGALNYLTKGYVGDKPSLTMPIRQRPGSNALETAHAVQNLMKQLSKNFPKGVDYKISLNFSNFIQESVDGLKRTIFEAIFLVFIVIVMFLQNWRATLIPILAIPISLVGTFTLMNMLNFSINNLTLFGLVLAVGIVVDDAIVVVENVERYLEKGLSPVEAAKKTMTEVSGALISIGLVLVAVFLPTAFLGGITGAFYRQFGLTIAVSTSISVFVSITLSPALSAKFLKKRHNGHPEKDSLGNKLRHTGNLLGNKFNAFIELASVFYSRLLERLFPKGKWVLLIYAGLISLSVYLFQTTPSGFVPQVDRGYLMVIMHLPPGASISRTDSIMKVAQQKILAEPGISTIIAFTGIDPAGFSNASNAGALFPVMKPYREREPLGLSIDQVKENLEKALASIKGAELLVATPPSIRGVGRAAGFRMMIQDRGGLGLETLKDATNALVERTKKNPVVSNVTSFFNTGTPSLFLDIDRIKAEQLGIATADVFQALEVYLGSAYVSDFIFQGRIFRVVAQADPKFKKEPEDLMQIRVRNQFGSMVPLGSFVTLKNATAPILVTRYNLYTAIPIIGIPGAGYSSGEALEAMEDMAQEILPPGIAYEWTELAYQEKLSGGSSSMAFALAVVFVFFLLAATYESWKLPFIIILIVPMVLLSAMVGINMASLDNNILVQIGLVVLVGLACKNAILIVEFAKQLEDEGHTPWQAAITSAKLRFRPILMTSLAFILGVVPLVFAKGAGSELRHALGVTVFSGMLGVTLFGLLFTPVFYYFNRSYLSKK